MAAQPVRTAHLLTLGVLTCCAFACAFAAVPVGGPYQPEELVPFCTPLPGGNASDANNVNCTLVAYDPNTPLVPCEAVPQEFMLCSFDDYSELSDGDYAALSPETQQLGCRTYGSQRGQAPAYVTATCVVVPQIECAGNHTFYVENTFQCVRYNAYHYPTILLFSVFLGWLGVDRFCLGYTCMGVGKFLTVGGIGIWWLVDLVLLTAGVTVPNAGYAWEPYF